MRLTPETASRLIASLSPVSATAILGALDPSIAVTFLNRLDPEPREQLLGTLDPTTASELRALSSYPPNSAGALMDARVLALRPETTVGVLGLGHIGGRTARAFAALRGSR